MNPLWGLDNKQIQTLDCTVRDGGLVNDHKFTYEFVKAVYEASVAAGVEYMEVGYKNSDRLFPRDQNGPWKFCDEDDIRRIVGDHPSPTTKLACMIDAGKSDWKTAVLPKSKSPLSMIRVAYYEYQLDEAVEMIEDAYEKGYEVSANLMAVTTIEEKALDRALERIAKTPASVIVIVDSFGTLTPPHTRYLVKKYMDCAQEYGKEVGIHAHNNMQLAFANTFVAAEYGATRLDASIDGLGRGAGNCPMELLIPVIKSRKYNLRPIIECLEKQFVTLSKEIEWGPTPEYGFTAQNNVHPRAAIAARKSAEMRDKYTLLFDRLTAEAKEAEAHTALK